MSKSSYLGANVVATGDTFSGWINKTNQLIYDLGTVVVTTSAVAQPNATNGGLTSGNAQIQGIFSANTVAVIDGLRGGTTSTPAALNIVSNTNWSGVGNVHIGTTTLHANTGTFNVTGNVNINTGTAKLFYLNSPTAAINGAAYNLNVNVFTQTSNTAIINTQTLTVTGNTVFNGGFARINNASFIVSGANTNITNTVRADVVSPIINLTGNITATGLNTNVTSNTTTISGNNTIVNSNTRISGPVLTINSTNTNITSTVGITGATTITGRTIVTGNTTVNGNTDIQGTVTTNGASVSVTSPVVSVTGATTITGNTAINGNTVVQGDVTTNGSIVTVTAPSINMNGDVSSNGGLSVTAPVGKTVSVVAPTATINASSVFVNANTNISGTTTIVGPTTISGSNTLITSANTNITSTGTNITGVVRIGGSSFNVNSTNTNITSVVSVTGNTTITGNTAVRGNFTSNSASFIANTTTLGLYGNTTIGGINATINANTVNVSSNNTTFNSPTTINGTTTIVGDTFISGNTARINSANVDIISTATKVSGIVEISGPSIAINSTSTNIVSTVGITGTTTFTGNTSVTGDFSTTGTSFVANATTISLYGNTTIGGLNTNVNANNMSVSSNNLTFNAPTTINGTTTIVGPTAISGSNTVISSANTNITSTGTNVTGTVRVGGPLFAVTSTNTNITSTVGINGATTVSGNTVVRGNFTANSASFIANTTTLGLYGNTTIGGLNTTISANNISVSSNSLTFDAPTTIDGSTTLNGPVVTISANNTSVIGNTFSVNARTSIQGANLVITSANTNITSNVSITGTTRASGQTYVSGTTFSVNATNTLIDSDITLNAPATKAITFTGPVTNINTANTNINGTLNITSNTVMSGSGSLTINYPNIFSTSNVMTTGDLTANNVTVSGTLTVSGGSSTSVTVENMNVMGKTIALNDGASKTDAAANGGGIVLKGTTDKAWLWIDATDSWTSTESVDVAAGRSYKIGGVDVLSASGLGAGITQSSLTSVGNVSTGTWNATTIAVNRGGTGQTSYSNGQILIGSGTGLTKGTITGGQNVTVTLGAGTISVAAANTNISSTSNTTNVTIVSSTGSNASMPLANSTSAGIISSGDKTKLDGIAPNAIASVPLVTTYTTDTTTIGSSAPGSNATITAANSTTSGVMTSADRIKLDGIAPNAIASVPLVKTGNTTVVIVGSSAPGSNATITAANSTVAGILTSADKAKLDGIEPNAISSVPLVKTGNTTSVTIGSSAPGSNATITAANSTVAGILTSADKAKLDGIAAGAQVNVPTNLSITYTTDDSTIISSTGSNVVITAANNTTSGVMTAADRIKIDGIDAGAQVNVPTNISVYYGPSTIAVNSSTGASGTVTAANSTTSGVMTSADKTKLDGIAAGAIATVPLVKTGNTTSVTIGSSAPGSNATITAANSTVAGILTSADKGKLDGIAAGAQVNVPTNLSTTYTTTATTIVSSTGTNSVITGANSTTSGVMTSADKGKLDGIAAGAQVNVPTNIGVSYGTGSVTISSSTGTNGTILGANSTVAGLLTAVNQTISGTKTFTSPIDSDLSGNAATATKLATARTINGISFDGSANIDILSLRNAGLTLINGSSATDGDTFFNITRQVGYAQLGVTSAATDASIRLYAKGAGNIHLFGDSIYMHGTARIYNGTGTVTINNLATANSRTLTLPDANVTLVGGTMVPTSGSGATGTWGIGISGNAATATKLATARTINGVSFDGTSNITITDGSSLTSLNASNISTGTISDARLPSTMGSKTLNGLTVMNSTITLNADASQAYYFRSAAGTNRGGMHFDSSTGSVSLKTFNTSGATTSIANLTSSGSFQAPILDAATRFEGKPDDTASAPSYTWTGDTNTGMYRPSTDVIAFSTSGTERGRINSSGFSGNGSQLTSLNASALTTGMVPWDRLPIARLATTDSANSFTGNQVITNGHIYIRQAASAAKILYFQNNDGTNQGHIQAHPDGRFIIQNYTATGAGNGNITIRADAKVTASSGFAGDGSELSGLNASNISSGTIADARLPSNMSGKTFAGSINIETSSPSIYLIGNGNKHLWYRDDNGNNRAVIYHETSDNSVSINNYNTSGDFLTSYKFYPNGTFAANRFEGNASGLTWIPASELNGTVPTAALGNVPSQMATHVAGQVGTYAFMRTGTSDGTAGTFTANTTRAGSSLWYTNSSTNTGLVGPTASGTWRCMGYTKYNQDSTLWLRIA